MNSIPIVHVTGTNGKGSVSLKIARCLRQANIKTGLFTSPHISSFRERIMVNEDLISEKDIEEIFPVVFKHCLEQSIPATFFELTTALAFMKFKLSQCEAVVLEVGLGGRLDATNIVCPSLCVITAIQMDHAKILGDTIEKIALEKAGIMKPGVDVLIGPGCPIDIMRTEAARVGANMFTLEDLLQPDERRYKWNNTASPSSTTDSSKSNTPTAAVPIASDIDDLNYDIAHAALKLLQHRQQHKGTVFERLTQHSTEFYESALKTRPPCRFEVFHQEVTVPHGTNGVDINLASSSKKVKIDVVLDIAHNVEALRSLAEKVKLVYSGIPIRVVMGMSADKDVASCIPHVLDLVGHEHTDRIHCTAARHPRAMSPPELRKITSSLSSSAVYSSSLTSQEQESQLDNPSVSNTVRLAMDILAKECAETKTKVVTDSKNHSNDVVDGVVIVCGTAFIMTDARQELGVVEPRDAEELFFSPTQLPPSHSIASNPPHVK